MIIGKLLYVLYKIKLLSLIALGRLVISISKYGINLMTLLHFSAQINGRNTAIVDEDESITYKQLFLDSKRVGATLQQSFNLTTGVKVAILCRNHISLVKAIFAVSSTGADLYLLHTELSAGQLNNVLKHKQFALLIYDEDLSDLISQTSYRQAKLLSYHDHLPAINNIQSNLEVERKRVKLKSGRLIILTGGTTGNAKEINHKPSLLNYLGPFAAILSQLKLNNYHSVFVATPIYHGYGLAFVLLFTLLGKKIVLQRKFHAEQTCEMIQAHQVEAISLVPLMLHKLLHTNAHSLRSLACIASGSAQLSPKLVQQTQSQLGAILYNLYGTSETGLNIIATPQHLRNSQCTIGMPISGSKVKIVDAAGDERSFGEIGRLVIHNRLTKQREGSTWVNTGDLAYRDEKGYYYLCGRLDSMIVSAGENVYPYEVEQVLLMHPDVNDAAVVGVEDEWFGQRLKAFVVINKQAEMVDKDSLFAWLRSRVARFQLPRDIVIVDRLPYTALGKVNKKVLK